MDWRLSFALGHVAVDRGPPKPTPPSALSRVVLFRFVSLRWMGGLNAMTRLRRRTHIPVRGEEWVDGVSSLFEMSASMIGHPNPGERDGRSRLIRVTWST